VALLDLRLRSGYLFLALMFGHVILISAQVNSRQGVPVLESVTFGVFSEVQRGTSNGLSVFQRIWNGYVGLRGAHAENEQLKASADKLAADKAALQQQLAEAKSAPAAAAAAQSETEAKLATALRSYSALQGENDALKSAQEKAAADGDYLMQVKSRLPGLKKLDGVPIIRDE